MALNIRYIQGSVEEGLAASKKCFYGNATWKYAAEQVKIAAVCNSPLENVQGKESSNTMSGIPLLLFASQSAANTHFLFLF